MVNNNSGFEVRLAKTSEDVIASQKLRYSVFVDEFGAKTSKKQMKEKLETDIFDNYCDHLLLIDKKKKSDLIEGKVVGVYRLMKHSNASNGIGFYSQNEYDLTLLFSSGMKCLELGRSCVAQEYRNGLGLYLLWEALAQYVAKEQIDLLFGVASFKGVDPSKISKGLSILHHKYIAPKDIRISALPHSYLSMDIIPIENINYAEAMLQIPSLIKSYIRLGGVVGDGAFIDYDFNTIDVGIIMDTKIVKKRYKKFNQKLF